MHLVRIRQLLHVDKYLHMPVSVCVCVWVHTYVSPAWCKCNRSHDAAIWHCIYNFCFKLFCGATLASHLYATGLSHTTYTWVRTVNMCARVRVCSYVCMCVRAAMHNREPAARRIQTEISKGCTLFCCCCCCYKSPCCCYLLLAATLPAVCAALCTLRTFSLAHSRCDRVELHTVHSRGLRRRLQDLK